MTSEPIGVSSSVSATNNYGFDANKLGVLTSAQWSGGLTNRWQATSLNGLGQISQESWNQSGLTLRSSGSAGSATSVSATLDGSPVGGLVLGSGRWYADLNVGSGNHTLVASATYPTPPTASAATNTFTVVNTNNVTDYYDGAGNVTSRVFANGKTQTLTWDGLGRLVSMTQRDSSNNGFNWTAVYDGFGRRLRTTQTPVAANVVYSLQTLAIDSFYDPQVEFLELAVLLNGQRTWKVTGPDLNGRYGGIQGVGGVLASIRESDGATTSVINDFFGNVLATVSGTTANWSPIRVSGYGTALGYQAPVLSASVPLAETLLWRSRRIDPSGFYWLGARYYDPLAGHFLSADPLGHSASMSLYDYCSGDPLNLFDEDGRQPVNILSGMEVPIAQVIDRRRDYDFLAPPAAPGQFEAYSFSPPSGNVHAPLPVANDRTVLVSVGDGQVTQMKLSDFSAAQARLDTMGSGVAHLADEELANIALVGAVARLTAETGAWAVSRTMGALQARVDTAAANVLSDPAFTQRALAEGFSAEQVANLANVRVQATLNLLSTAEPGTIKVFPFGSSVPPNLETTIAHEFGHQLAYDAYPGLAEAEADFMLSPKAIASFEMSANRIGFGSDRALWANISGYAQAYPEIAYPALYGSIAFGTYGAYQGLRELGSFGQILSKH